MTVLPSVALTNRFVRSRYEQPLQQKAGVAMSRINAPVGVTTDQQPLLSGADDLIVVGKTAARAYSEVLVQLKNRNIPRQFNQRLR